jgi:ribonuclease VapC
MVVDASAIIAIMRNEPEEAIFIRALARSSLKRMSPVNWQECAMNVEQTGDFDQFDALVRRVGIAVTPIDEAQARLAHEAWRRFGKGRHRAKLNLGDCFAYALAKATGEPLLYKGGDFTHTDLIAAV